MTEVIPKLWLGDQEEAKFTQDFYIITVAIDAEFIGNEHHKIVDGPGNKKATFIKAVNSVVKAYNNHDKILVHCIGGRSRSAAVIVAAATKITKQPVCEIYDSLIAKHDIARIHPYLSLLLLGTLNKV